MDGATGAIVLAAGKGTRMRSDLPKVLHPLLGRPMISYVADALTELGFGTAAPRPVFVVGYGAPEVEAATDGVGEFVLQNEQLGTGHAAALGLRFLDGSARRVLLIHGDEPMIESDTYGEMLDLQHQSEAAVVLLTGEVSDAHELGRVDRDESGRIVGLVQESELSPRQQSILEINFGAYVFDRSFMEQSLPKLARHGGGEYYLTDLVHFAVEEGRTVEAVSVPYPDDQMGINDAEQLVRAEGFLRWKAGMSSTPSQTG